MNEQIKRKIALLVILILALVGLVGYSIKSSGEPVRVLFKTKGGPVIFDHKAHSDKGGYDIECVKCHHQIEGESEQRCRACHSSETEYDSICENAAPHRQCIGSNCITCHKEQGMDDGECNLCHK